MRAKSTKRVSLAFQVARLMLLGAPMLLGAWCFSALAGETRDLAPNEPPTGDPLRGYRFLLDTALVPPDFEEKVFDAAWEQWPEPLRTQAQNASPSERRRMAFSRYGLTPRPDDPEKPLQYVVGADGYWTMNCFACHGGQIMGAVHPGLPNSRYALQTLTDDTRAVKFSKGLPLDRMDVGSLFVPLGSSNGTTNAVMFGVVLMAYRDADLNVYPGRIPPALTNHDMEPPPWWHFKHKKMLYVDGFASKGHRGLMQFAMVRENGPEKFREWEDSFRDVKAYLESIEAPRYPFKVNAELAAKGRLAFDRVCAECHGVYHSAKEIDYPERLVPLDVVKTDPVRLHALSREGRKAYGESWFNEYGAKPNIDEPNGYVAPPLDGVWASAPYFHNGSVPTLWHVLRPETRPKVWRRNELGYDQAKVGLEIENFDRIPVGITDAREKREFFDTTGFGKSSGGHDFPNALSEEDKEAVLEYLKTL